MCMSIYSSFILLFLPQLQTANTSHTFTYRIGSTHHIDFIAVPLPSMAHYNVANTLEVQASHLGDRRASTLRTNLVIRNVNGSSLVKYDPLKFVEPIAAAGFNNEIACGSFCAFSEQFL